MSAGTDAVSAASPRRWRTFWVLAAAAALTILDVSKLGVALPAIQNDMGGSPATVQLMLVGYTIAYAAMLVPAGRIGDVLRRRTIFLTGATIFVVASLAGAAAPNVAWLVTARIAEGVGAGLLMPQVLGIIQRMFPAGERAKPLAALAALTTLTSLVAPVLAGAVMDLAGDAWGWRLLFLITVAAGVVIVPLAAMLVKEPPTTARRDFDRTGAVLLGAGVVLAIAPLSTSSGTLPSDVWPYVLTLLGAGLLTLFAFHERRVARRGGEALIDPALWRLPHFGPGVLVSGCMHAAATAGTLIVTLAYQQIAGRTPLETSLWMLPSACASLLGSWLASRVTSTSGTAVSAGAALGALALGGMGFAFAAAGAAALPWIIAALLGVSSFGSGLAAPANQARTLLFAPGHRASIAGSLIQFAQRTGSAVGMAVALIVYYAFFTRPTFAGQPAAGPMMALWTVAAMLLAGAAIALIDQRRTRRTAGRAETTPEAPLPVGDALADTGAGGMLRG